MQLIKKNISFLYRHFYYYLQYMIKHPICTLLIFAGVILSYGSYAFPTDYYVDSEVVINIPETNYNWLEIGRYGLIFTRKLLNTHWYNPYYTGILLLFFLFLTVTTLSYVCNKLFPKLTAPITAIGSLIFITYPTFSEQYYFHFQSAEIAFGLWLSMLSAGMFYLFVKQKAWICFFATLFVYVLTFSVYQAFIPLTLCIYLGIFLSLIFQEQTQTDTIQRGIFGSIAHFLLAFFISQSIDALFFPDSGYLSNQIVWTSMESFKNTFLSVFTTCLRMLLGKGIFYTTILLLAFLLCLAALWLYRKQPVYRIVLGTLAIIGISVVPFLLTILMGETTAIRSQFTYSLSAVFLLCFALQSFYEHTINTAISTKRLLYLKTTTACILSVITISQISTLNLIWKAHTHIADYDRKTATNVMTALYDSFIVNSDVGTILWGSLQPPTPYDDMLKGSSSYLFLSVFNLEHNTQPYCFYSTNRILGYMESMGHKFTFPNQRTHTISRYIMDRENLSAFPADNCSFNDSEAFTLNLGNCPEHYYR